MKKHISRKSLLLLLIAIFGVIWSFSDVALNDEPQTFDYLDLFAQVFELVQDKYLEKTDPQILAEGAVEGMLLEISPYCYMLPLVEETGLMPPEGALNAGLILGYRDQLLWAVDVIPESPADTAGIIPGEAIIQIGDQVTPMIPLFRAQRMLTGEEGNKIKLMIQSHITYQLHDRELTLKPFSERTSPVLKMFHSVTVLHPPRRITTGSIQEIENLLAGMDTSRGIILDLRHVNSGDVENGLKCADLFIEDGQVIGMTCNKEGSVLHRYRSKDNRAMTSFPMVIVIDATTAGPGETCAAALAMTRRARITGDRSFGQAVTRQRKKLNDRFDLMLIDGDFCTGDTHVITGNGIEPDVYVILPVPSHEDPFLLTASSVLESLHHSESS